MKVFVVWNMMRYILVYRYQVSDEISCSVVKKAQATLFALPWRWRQPAL